MNDLIYKEIILDLYRNPLNKGVLSDYDLKLSGTNPSCGDDVEIYVKFNEEGKIADISHNGSGCAISQAALSLVTDAVKGKTKDEVVKLTKDDMIEMLGIKIDYTREKCVMLGLVTLQKSL